MIACTRCRHFSVAFLAARSETVYSLVDLVGRVEMRPLTAALVALIVCWAGAFILVVLGNLGVPLVGYVGGGLGYLVLYGIPVVFYFIPTLAAASEKHHNLRAIAALNTLLGWTVLGWIAALIWALAKPHRD